MTRVINFVAGPGAGKSTLAAGLFHELKCQQKKVELVTEFVRELVLDGQAHNLDDQIYLLGNQNHRLYSLLDKVDYIITDSPLILQLYYNGRAFSKFKEIRKEVSSRSRIITDLDLLIVSLFNIYNNKIFFIDRTKRPVSQQDQRVGREKSQKDCFKIDEELRDILDKNGYSYIIVSTLEEVVASL